MQVFTVWRFVHYQVRNPSTIVAMITEGEDLILVYFLVFGFTWRIGTQWPAPLQGSQAGVCVWLISCLGLFTSLALYKNARLCGRFFKSLRKTFGWLLHSAPPTLSLFFLSFPYLSSPPDACYPPCTRNRSRPYRHRQELAHLHILH